MRSELFKQSMARAEAQRIELVYELMQRGMRRENISQSGDSIAISGNFMGFDFSGLNLARVEFQACDLTECDFSKSNLLCTVFDGCMVANSDFHEVRCCIPEFSFRHALDATLISSNESLNPVIAIPGNRAEWGYMAFAFVQEPRNGDTERGYRFIQLKRVTEIYPRILAAHRQMINKIFAFAGIDERIEI
jgi:uncharacterized protein YjbI with pentapeptide repeats